MVANEEHQGDDAETYVGNETKDSDGKITVTDEDKGTSISFTLTENADGTVHAEVDGHGQGDLKPYEGNVFSIITSMAEDEDAGT